MFCHSDRNSARSFLLEVALEQMDNVSIYCSRIEPTDLRNENAEPERKWTSLRGKFYRLKWKFVTGRDAGAFFIS